MMDRPPAPKLFVATKAQRKVEDEIAEANRRAFLFGERPYKPPTEVERLRREVAEMRERLKVAAEVLLGEHDCGWDD